jgi:hypothetical protein
MLKNKNLKLLKNITFFFSIFFQKYQNDTIVESGQIENQINANFKLSYSNDINFEKVQSSYSNSNEYKNFHQIISDDLRPEKYLLFFY